VSRQIAFLRAINVGGRTVPMERLRRLFEELGLAGVSTFIASGNVIFQTPRGGRPLETRIERHLQAALGYEVATFLRTPADLADLAGDLPFPSAEVSAPGASIYVAFLREPPSRDRRDRVLALRSDADDLHLRGRDLFWLRRDRVTSALSGAALEKALASPATVRNITTVRRLAAKYPG
jgi:uncharacterized protein (DUF1697 family)